MQREEEKVSSGLLSNLQERLVQTDHGTVLLSASTPSNTQNTGEECHQYSTPSFHTDYPRITQVTEQHNTGE